MSITKEQIYAVADMLNQEGIKPTLAAVRRRLGSGSFTTISEAVNEWKLMQLAAIESQPEVLPEIFKEHLYRFGTTLWTEALNTANRRFAQEHLAMTEQFNEKEIYYTELEKLSVDYDSELTGAKACIENLRNEVARIDNALHVKEEECIKLHQTLNQAESENKLFLQHNTELKQELAHTNKVVDKLQTNLTNLINNFDTVQKQFNDKISPAIAKKLTTKHYNN